MRTTLLQSLLVISSNRRQSLPGKEACPPPFRPPRTLLLLWGLLSLLPLAHAQEPVSTEPFFSVSSRQTYAPSQQPRVSVDFRQVDHLDFRIYRVKDPLLFFAKLRDAHSFGSEKQELARENTCLEKLHDWKRNLRLDIRDFFRRQVSYETRARRQEARFHQ